MSKPRPYRCHIQGCSRPTLRKTLDSFLCYEHAFAAWQEFEMASSGTQWKEAAASDLRAKINAQNESRKAQARASGVGTIYYLRLGETIKVGWTADLERRLSDYAPTAELIAHHPGTRADERDLHRTFRPSLTHRREWYRPDPELMAHIEAVISQHGGPDARFAPRNGLPSPRPRSWPRHVA